MERETIAELKKFHFKKKFGQNFLTDQNILEKIANAAKLDKETLVIEIGTGAGALTKKLAPQSGHVLTYEIDETLKKILAKELKSENITIKFADFLKSDVEKDLKPYNYNKTAIVANLPYYITTPIINKITNLKLPITNITIMVQKEVGDRFSAKINTKSYNSLSIYLNYYYSVEKLFDVSRNVFFPRPDVDSIILQFTPEEKSNKALDENFFFQFVQDSFKQKRKNLRNNLKKYNLSIIESSLKKIGFDLTSRAEQISLENFIFVANEYVTSNCK